MKGALGLGDFMKKAQEMQSQATKIEDTLRKLEIVGEAGAGMLKVVMNGQHDVKQVEIDPSLMAEDKEIIEDLVAAAINDAVRKVEIVKQDQKSDMASILGLPAGFKMPF